MNSLKAFSLVAIVLLLGCVSGNVITKRQTQCDQACTRDFRPVCASNGMTYNNKCVFEVEDCKKLTKDIVFIVKEGAC